MCVCVCVCVYIYIYYMHLCGEVRAARRLCLNSLYKPIRQPQQQPIEAYPSTSTAYIYVHILVYKA
jgi:hypothetical protein